MQSQTENIVCTLGNNLKQEFNEICLAKHKSIIMNDGEDIKSFLGVLYGQSCSQPTVLSILYSINSQDSKLVNCVVACMLLKKDT